KCFPAYFRRKASAIWLRAVLPVHKKRTRSLEADIASPPKRCVSISALPDCYCRSTRLQRTYLDTGNRSGYVFGMICNTANICFNRLPDDFGQGFQQNEIGNHESAAWFQHSKCFFKDLSFFR